MVQGLDDLENLTHQEIDTKCLFESVVHSFRIIERWTEASSNDSRVQPIINSIKSEVVKFYRSVDQSVTTAEAGYGFSKNAEHLCYLLKQPRGTYSDEDLQDYIDELLVLARTAFTEAETMCHMLRDNREQFNRIAKSIPGTNSAIRAERQTHNEEKARAQSNKDTYAMTAVGLAGLSGVKLAAVGIAAAPLGLIVLTVALPASAIFLFIKSHQHSEKAIARGTKSEECGNALMELQNADRFFVDIVGHLDKTVKYWLDTSTALSSLRNDIGRLQLGRISTIKIDKIKGDWGKQKGRYMDYKSDVSRLQDLFPASKPLKSSSGAIYPEKVCIRT